MLQKSHFIRCCVLDRGKSIMQGALLTGQVVAECITEIPPDWDIRVRAPRECHEDPIVSEAIFTWSTKTMP